jgi:hypothetical protein
MRLAVPNPDGSTIIEFDERPSRCAVLGCAGAVVRHSLGSGQSIDRCTRCFRRYQVRAHVSAPPEKSRFRRALDNFVTWRDD